MLKVQLQIFSKSESKHYGDGFSEADNTYTPGGKKRELQTQEEKKELQTQVTYFHYCHKDLCLNKQKARSCIQGLWM